MTQQRREGLLPPAFDTLGLRLERGNRYAYFLSDGPMETRDTLEAQNVAGALAIGVDTFKFKGARPLKFKHLPPDVASQVGTQGTCPDCQYVAACAGDTDNNPLDAPDVWSIATMDRVIDGKPVPGGEPYHHVNDVETHGP
jgi:hypothetical protein